MATRFPGSLLAGAVVLLLAPAAAHAQGSIVGVVRDASGAVLPGVAVEATGSRPEESRRTVTDRNGRYALVDMPAGAYALTFTLAGFGTATRLAVVRPESPQTTVDVVIRAPAGGATIALPGPRVVCGTTVIPADPTVDPKIRKQPDLSTRYTIVPVPPSMCR